MSEARVKAEEQKLRMEKQAAEAKVCTKFLINTFFAGGWLISNSPYPNDRRVTSRSERN